MCSSNRPPEPWDSVLIDLDAAVDGPVRLDCIGGFVVTQVYGLDRTTGDVDVIDLAPREVGDMLLSLAARGGLLARKHSVYIDRVAVAHIPEDYESRLVEMFPGLTSTFGSWRRTLTIWRFPSWRGTVRRIATMSDIWRRAFPLISRNYRSGTPQSCDGNSVFLSGKI
jgi:hypothetical protein